MYGTVSISKIVTAQQYSGQSQIMVIISKGGYLLRWGAFIQDNFFFFLFINSNLY